MNFTPAVVIPFRDRGRDPLRSRNLDAVLEHWERDHDTTAHVFSDGRSGDAQFNRSAAYNRAVAALPDVDVFVFTESDMLVDAEQIEQAVGVALAQPGLVVPFTEYRFVDETHSDHYRAGLVPYQTLPFTRQISHGRSIGAINVVSRAALDLVGRWDESFDGAWYDDIAMCHAFAVCCHPTRWVKGSAYHLYHAPSGSGDHRTEDDVRATTRNQARSSLYQAARTPEQVRQLTLG